MTYSEETLRRFLDGELPADLTDEIVAAMEQDDTLEQRILALDEFHGSVEPEATGLPDEAKRQELEEWLREAHARFEQNQATRGKLQGESASDRQRGGFALVRRWGALAATLALGVVIGAGGYDRYLQDQPLSWQMEVASYQALYVTETLSGLDNSPEILSEQIAQVSDVLRLSELGPRLDDLGSLELVRAQVLGFNSLPLVQVAYLDPDGEPVALCIINRNDVGQDSELQMKELLGMAAASWETEDHKFLLIGRIKDSDMQTLATEARSRFL